MNDVFYAGTYAAADQTGILRIEADFENGRFTERMAFSGIENASWLLLHPNGRVLYAVVERNPDGGLCAFRVQEEGLELLARFPSGGADPCHLSLDSEARHLFVANYTSGTLGVFALDADGVPTRRTDLKRHEGSGPNASRQEGPHMHFTMLCGDLLYAVDLGADRVRRYRFDSEAGTLAELQTQILTPGGTGPRHFVLHPQNPNLMYVICELTAEICVFRIDGEEAAIIQRIGILPEGYEGTIWAAAIRLSEDGRALFASNRGSDSIALFAISADGLLEKRDVRPTGGRTPRDFNVFGNRLVCANQDSGYLTVLRYDSEAMTLEASRMTMAFPVQNGSQVRPVCVLKVR